MGSHRNWKVGSLINPFQVKLARRARGMDLGDLADPLGIAPDILEFFEEGEQEMPEDFLPALVALLEFPREFFLKWPSCSNCGHIAEGNIPKMNSLLLHIVDTRDPVEVLRQQNEVLLKKIQKLEERLANQ